MVEYEHVLLELACVSDLSARKIHFGTQQTAPSTLETLVIQQQKTIYKCNVWHDMVSHWKLQCQWPHSLFHPIPIGQTHACDLPVNTSYPFSIGKVFLLRSHPKPDDDCTIDRHSHDLPPPPLFVLSVSMATAAHTLSLSLSLHFRNSIKFNLLLFRLFLDIIYADNSWDLLVRSTHMCIVSVCCYMCVHVFCAVLLFFTSSLDKWRVANIVECG